MTPVLLICAGLILVVISADVAIKRLSKLAVYFRIPDFVISFIIAGIIVVLPELTIGIVAALEGLSLFGLGLILGANVADLTLVIGVVLLFAGRLKLDPVTVKNIKFSFVAIVLPVLLFLDGELSRLDGIILLFAFMLYALILLRTRRDGDRVAADTKKPQVAIEFIIVFISMMLVVAGGHLITTYSQEVSILLGFPLILIGVIVAIGTCLPEMIFAISASKKKLGELGLGNILGNVLVDALLTIGLIALIQPIQPKEYLSTLFTGGFMVLSTFLLVVQSGKGELNRKDGAILIVAYSVFLILQFTIGV